MIIVHSYVKLPEGKSMKVRFIPCSNKPIFCNMDPTGAAAKPQKSKKNHKIWNWKGILSAKSPVIGGLFTIFHLKITDFYDLWSMASSWRHVWWHQRVQSGKRLWSIQPLPRPHMRCRPFFLLVSFSLQRLVRCGDRVWMRLTVKVHLQGLLGMLR